MLVTFFSLTLILVINGVPRKGINKMNKIIRGGENPYMKNQSIIDF